MTAQDVLLGQRAPCLICAAELHPVAELARDEWVWVDATGSHTGTDPDLAGFDPDQRFAFLASELGRAVAGRPVAGWEHDDRNPPHTRTSRQVERTWLYWAYAKEYGALKVRLDAGTWHCHHPNHMALAPWQRPVPYHCGWPAWLRPSGYHCRQCNIPLAEPMERGE